MSEIEQLKKRIEELEIEVARLKAMPQHVIHSHYHYQDIAPRFLPTPTWTPRYPQITYSADNGTAG